jgi:anti-sigma regulatory factor (Ser/Thr protein kinase)
MSVVPGLQEHQAIRWDGVSEDTLAQSLVAPARACIEAGLQIDDGAGDANNGENRLSLTVSIQSIYRHAIARVFLLEIGHRLALGQELRDRIHTALHEVLLNAVMHGHVQLEPGIRDSLGGFEASHEAIKRQLASEKCAHKRVVIEAQWNAARLSIAVRDNGVGFDPNSSDAARHRGSGRGLLILDAFCDSVTYRNNGTVVILGFEL